MRRCRNAAERQSLTSRQGRRGNYRPRGAIEVLNERAGCLAVATQLSNSKHVVAGDGLQRKQLLAPGEMRAGYDTPLRAIEVLNHGGCLLPAEGVSNRPHVIGFEDTH